MVRVQQWPSTSSPTRTWSCSATRRGAPTLPDAAFQLIYIDPPFNTGKAQQRRTIRSATTPATARFRGAGTRPPSSRQRYRDVHDDYLGFLEPRLREAWRLLAADGTLYLHLDYREAHYAKVLLDAVFGRDCFLNETDLGLRLRRRARERWPAKHDTILVYVRTPRRALLRPGRGRPRSLHGARARRPEKAARGKLPTDVWWHTIVPTDRAREDRLPESEARGHPAPDRAGLLAPGDRVLDFFAGSGTTGAVAGELGRRFVLIDRTPRRSRSCAAACPATTVFR